MGRSIADAGALVVGGGTGIGWAVARALADAGANVAIAGRREEAREAVAGYSGPRPIRRRTADVASLESVGELVAWAEGELGRIDILVNSAGVNVQRRSMAQLSPGDWEKMLQINATGAFYLMHCALPGMRRQGDGLIVNISSIAGKRATLLGGVGYNASKFAMTALGTTAAIEEAEHGVRISNVYPGEVDTPILLNRPTPVTAEHRARILQPEDVADAVLMMAQLPPRAHVPELVIKPTSQPYS